MSFLIGLFALLWVLGGVVVFGLMINNFFQKGHKPLQILPIALILVILFGGSAVSMYYYATQSIQSFDTLNINTNGRTNSSQQNNNLYR